LDRLILWLDRSIFIGLLAVLFVTVVLYGTVDEWWQAVFEAAVLTLTALWAIKSVLLRNWRLKKAFILLPIALLTVYAFLQLVTLPYIHRPLTIDRYQTWLTARKILTLTLFTGLLLVHTSSPRRLRGVVRALIVLGVGSAIFGIMRQLLQVPDATTGFVLPLLFPGLGYGEFFSPTLFSYLMEMTFALLLGAVLGGGIKRPIVPVYLAAALLVWAALILSNSRGGLISITCATIFIVFSALSWYSERRMSARTETLAAVMSAIRSPWFRVIAVLLIVLTLAGGMLWFGGERLTAKIRAENTTADTIDGTTRKEIWRATWELVKSNPVTGAGFGTYFLAITEHQRGSGRLKLEQSHNDYLDLLANGGFVAFLLAAWFVVMVAVRARASLRSRDPYRRAVCLGAAAGMIGVAVHSSVDFGLQCTGMAVVFAVLVVISTAGAEVESQRVEVLNGKSARRVEA
jgi:O-antigen ligase